MVWIPSSSNPRWRTTALRKIEWTQDKRASSVMTLTWCSEFTLKSYCNSELCIFWKNVNKSPLRLKDTQNRLYRCCYLEKDPGASSWRVNSGTVPYLWEYDDNLLWLFFCYSPLKILHWQYYKLWVNSQSPFFLSVDSMQLFSSGNIWFLSKHFVCLSDIDSHENQFLGRL